MSAEATGWVWRRSPYKGVTFAVHLAIADSVNDQNEHELWMRQSVLAEKCRTQRPTVNKALATLLADGYLELVEEFTGGANRYRFLMPSKAPVVFDSRRKRVKGDTTTDKPAVRSPHTNDGTEGVTPANTNGAPIAQQMFAEQTQGVRSPHTEPKGTQVVTQEEPPRTGSVAQPIVKAVWDRKVPKPATPFIAAVKIAERLLASEWSPDEIEQAMVDAPTISVGAVELTLNRNRDAKPRRGAAGPVTSRRDGPEGRVQA